MDEKSLRDKQVLANTKFEELGQKIQEHTEERLRLSGEFRALEGLIGDLTKKVETAVDPAKTVAAEPKETTNGAK